MTISVQAHPYIKAKMMIITHWAAERGYRRRGWPRRRWSDDLDVISGQTWSEIAQNKNIEIIFNTHLSFSRVHFWQ